MLPWPRLKCGRPRWLGNRNGRVSPLGAFAARRDKRGSVFRAPTHNTKLVGVSLMPALSMHTQLPRERKKTTSHIATKV